MKESRAKNDYNLLAPFYDWLGKAMFFGAIAKSQRRFLHDIPINARILFIGGGTGFLLNDLLESARPECIYYVEKSSEMIRKSEEACTHQDNQKVHFIHGTQDDLPDEFSCNVVLSFFFFDQFEAKELMEIFHLLDKKTSAEAWWLWSDFIPPETWWQRILMNTMLRFFQFTTELSTRRVFHVPEMFVQSGYLIEKEDFFYKGFIRSVVMKKAGGLSPVGLPGK
ncbi:MAG: methyltransferase domain-containing protein [Bacteroidetes bacterium]|nr:methyltransferase domain-containing protein [Bacteroidota bacterium]